MTSGFWAGLIRTSGQVRVTKVVLCRRPQVDVDHVARLPLAYPNVVLFDLAPLVTLSEFPARTQEYAGLRRSFGYAELM